MNRRITDKLEKPDYLWKAGAWTPAAFLWVGIAGSGSCIFLNLLIARIAFWTNSYDRALNWLSVCPYYIRLVTAGFIFPVAEELMFRGLGYTCLRKRFSFIQAALISSVCFAIYHGNSAQGLYAFVLGLIMAWICEQYHNLILSVWFHMSANISAVFFAGFMAEMQQRFTSWPVLVMSASLVFLGIYKIKRGCKYHEIVIYSNSLL